MKAMPNLEFEESVLRRNKEKWNKQVLLLSMAIFLCLTTTLTTIIVLNNFVIVYETRNMLWTNQQPISVYQSPYPIPISGTTIIGTVTTPSQQNSESMTKFTQEISTSVETSTPKSSEQTSFSNSTEDVNSTNSTMQTSFGTSTEDVNYPTETTPTLLNPVIILNDVVGSGNLVKYLCMELCASPSVIASQLNLTLSSNGRNDNFLHLTVPVNTGSLRIAKAKVAYLALNYLYKDYVNQSLVYDEWNLPVPNDCTIKGNKTWPKCK